MLAVKMYASQEPFYRWVKSDVKIDTLYLFNLFYSFKHLFQFLPRKILFVKFEY